MGWILELFVEGFMHKRLQLFKLSLCHYYKEIIFELKCEEEKICDEIKIINKSLHYHEMLL